MSISKGRDRIIRDVGHSERHFDEPKHLKSRIIANNLDDKVSLESIEDKFNMYGKVLGVSQHRTFTYIQYENEAAALTAIKEVHNNSFRGRKLDVRLVKDSKFEEKPRFTVSQRNSSSVSKSRDYSRDSYSRSSYRDRSPTRVERENDDPYSQEGNTTSRHGRADDRIGEPGYGTKIIDANRPLSSNPYEQLNALPYKSRNVTAEIERERSPQANDCEIIVCNQSLSDYAESLELRLKYMGMKVDILFPKEKSPILQILEDISSRRCLYALVVTSQNKVHKSITVNILYGTPQEHRNMPLEDAMLLISRNFDNYKREMTARKVVAQENISSAIMQPHDFIPSTVSQSSQNSVGSGGRVLPLTTNSKDIKFLFHLLADGKQLSLKALNRVISHLQDCRERLLAENRGLHSSASSNNANLQDNMNQCVEKPQISVFQEKIFSLMTNQPLRSQTTLSENTYTNRPEPINNKWGNATGALSSVDNGQMTKNPTANAPFINFDNPSIKQALDSLIQSGPNLLHSLGSVPNTSTVKTLRGGDHYRDPKPFNSSLTYPTNSDGSNSRSTISSSDPYYYQRQFYN